ncbi:hypothetical protein BH23PLA1_BH23PLA1_10560 [soil metagenome]
MIQATCRCGQLLKVPGGADTRVVCPSCGKRVRVRCPDAVHAKDADAAQEDGFLRFFCPCGRRLKVPAAAPPTHGKCPDCGRVVPVPMVGAARSGDRTEDLGPQDLEKLRLWAAEHARRGSRVPAGAIANVETISPSTRTKTLGQAQAPTPAPAHTDRSEAGFRLCSNCGKPLHLRAETCRECGTPAPKRD